MTRKRDHPRHPPRPQGYREVTNPAATLETPVLIFDAADDLAAVIGLPLTSEPGDKPSFDTESDWGYALRGAGCEGGIGRSRWLLTFVTGSPEDEAGHLIAYEIDPGNERTGRCALLRTPWLRDTDWVELRRIHASEWWKPNGEAGEADISELDEMLAGPRVL